MTGANSKMTIALPAGRMLEEAAAALNILRQDENTSLTLGDETAIFWAVQGDRSVDCSFVALLEAAEAGAQGAS